VSVPVTLCDTERRDAWGLLFRGISLCKYVCSYRWHRTTNQVLHEHLLNAGAIWEGAYLYAVCTSPTQGAGRVPTSPKLLGLLPTPIRYDIQEPNFAHIW